jgi:hypothetical protein
MVKRRRPEIIRIDTRHLALTLLRPQRWTFISLSLAHFNLCTKFRPREHYSIIEGSRACSVLPLSDTIADDESRTHEYQHLLQRTQTPLSQQLHIRPRTPRPNLISCPGSRLCICLKLPDSQRSRNNERREREAVVPRHPQCPPK